MAMEKKKSEKKIRRKITNTSEKSGQILEICI